MRLGLLGPASEDKEALARAAKHLRTDLQADRVLYLGADRMLEALVRSWAEALVGPRADDFTVMARATSQCLTADPAAIDQFLERETERSHLRMYESLPGETTRAVELVGGKVAVMLYDKANLEEEDILPATLLIFGKNREPLIKQVGRRWFLSPGSFPQHGMMLIDDSVEQLRAFTYDSEMNQTAEQILSAPKTLRMRASGAD